MNTQKLESVVNEAASPAKAGGSPGKNRKKLSLTKAEVVSEDK